MKEATGELNMTVITVLIIAALGVLIVTVVIPLISGGMAGQARCASAYGCGNCETDGNRTCDGYYDEDGEAVVNQITCSCTAAESK